MSAPPSAPSERERLALLREIELRPLAAWRALLLLAALAAWLGAGREGAPLFLAAWGALALLAAGATAMAARPGAGRAFLWAALSFAGELATLLLMAAASGARAPLLLPLWGVMALRALPLSLWGRGIRRLAWAVPLALPLLLPLDLPFAAIDLLLFALALAAVVALALAVGERVARGVSERAALALQLARRESDLGVRTQVLTQTATNLANSLLELRSLQEAIKAINASLALETLLAGTVESVAQRFGGTACAIGLREPDGTLTIAARSSDPPPRADVLPLAQRATASGEPTRWSLAALDGGVPLLGLAVPLFVEGEAIGALVAVRANEMAFTSDDQQRLTTFADQAALAVNNSRLYGRVETLYRQVKDRSEELEAVLDSIGDAVIVSDSAGGVLLTNPVAAVILGLPDPIPAGARLPPELLGSSFANHVLRALEGGRDDSVLGELAIQHEGALQMQRSYQALSAPLRDAEGKPRGVVTVLRDVTAGKELERLKSNFVSTISHELKTPLHTIKGFLNIVLAERSAGPLTATQRDFLSTARDQTSRLERLILDLLEFNRLESGQIKLNPQPLDLAELMTAAAEQFRAVAQEARVTLECCLDEPLRAEGDGLRLEQVLHNLLGNALKFTPPGGRVLLGGHGDEATVELVVRDTGIGIPPEARERVFERFVQLDAAQDRRYGGTGLGLAIAKHIVERHGGRIWVEGALGEGSAFHVELPRSVGQGRALTVDFSELKSGESA